MLNKNDKITLISVHRTQDSDGFSIENETASEVWGCLDSITGTEFYQSGLLGIQPSLRATVWLSEYKDQTMCEVEGKRYRIYRTYKRNLDEIELYMEERGGVK